MRGLIAPFIFERVYKMLAKKIDINGTEISLKFGILARKKYQENFNKKFDDVKIIDEQEAVNLIFVGQTDTTYSTDDLIRIIDNGEKPYIETATCLAYEINKAINLSNFGKEELEESNGKEELEDKTEKN